jgi:hypothetical protein
MLLNTRRRMLGLLAAAIGTSRLGPPSSALAAKTEENTDEKPAARGRGFALQSFGDWKGVATNTQAGARIGQISFADSDSCDLRGEISVAEASTQSSSQATRTARHCRRTFHQARQPSHRQERRIDRGR